MLVAGYTYSSVFIQLVILQCFWRFRRDVQIHYHYETLTCLLLLVAVRVYCSSVFTYLLSLNFFSEYTHTALRPESRSSDGFHR